jgi:hypothetical protein
VFDTKLWPNLKVIAKVCRISRCATEVFLCRDAEKWAEEGKKGPFWWVELT